MARQGNNWKSFDDRALEKGLVLVPQLVTQDYARELGANMKNLRTWKTAGVPYSVMFVPVSSNMEDICWKAFYSDLNEYLDERLGPARCGRCIVSLDALLEENYLPAEIVAAAEDLVMERVMLEELIVELERKNPLFADVIRLGYGGMCRKDIVDTLPVKKSQAYEVIKRCREEVEKWLF